MRRLRRSAEVEDALWDTILIRIGEFDSSVSIERILISDTIAGVDITRYCPDCESWDHSREYFSITAKGA